MKVRAAIMTDMPVQELAKIFGPIHIHEGIYVTRVINSPDHAKTLVGTAQSRAERYGYKEFGAHIIRADKKPETRRRKYRVAGPLKARLDYGFVDRNKDYDEHPEPGSFYDRLGKNIQSGTLTDAFLPEERAAFERWLGVKSGKMTNEDIRVILRIYYDSLAQFDANDPVFGEKQFMKIIQEILGYLVPPESSKIWNAIEGLKMLSEMPQYQTSVNGNGNSDTRPEGLPAMDVVFPKDIAEEHPGGSELEQLSPETIKWILSLPGKVSQEDVQRHIKVMLGLHVPIDRINEFMGMLKLTVGQKAEASNRFMNDLQQKLGQDTAPTYAIQVVGEQRDIRIQNKEILRMFVAWENLPTNKGDYINVIKANDSTIQYLNKIPQRITVSSHECVAHPVKVETVGDVKVLESGPDKLRVRFSSSKYDGTYLFLKRGGRVWRMVKR